MLIRLLSIFFFLLFFTGCLPGQMTWTSSNSNRSSGNANSNDSSDGTGSGENGGGNGGKGTPPAGGNVNGNFRQRYGYTYNEGPDSFSHREYGKGIVQLHDGRVVMGMTQQLDSGESGVCGVYVLNSDGTRDTTTNNGLEGAIRFDIPDSSDCQVNALAYSSAPGLLYLAGWVNMNSTGKNFLVARLIIKPNIEIDTSFGGARTGYRFDQPVAGLPAEIRALKIVGNESIFVAGSAPSDTSFDKDYFLVGKYSDKGIPDGAFGDRGSGFSKVILTLGATAIANALTFDDSDGMTPLIHVMGNHQLEGDQGAVVSVNASTGSPRQNGLTSNVYLFTDQKEIVDVAFQSINSRPYLIFTGRKDPDATPAQGYIARVAATNFAPDISFDGGEVTLPASQNTALYPIAMQLSADRVFLVARALDGVTSTTLYAYKNDGKLDGAFANNGKPFPEEEFVSSMSFGLTGNLIMTGWDPLGNNDILFRSRIRNNEN